MIAGGAGGDYGTMFAGGAGAVTGATIHKAAGTQLTLLVGQKADNSGGAGCSRKRLTDSCNMR